MTQPTTASKIGDQMPDGTIYAGISPDTNQPMYATPSDAPLTMTVNQAKEYAWMLDAQGHHDWRVPTKTELNVLFNNRVAIGGFKIDNPKDQPCTSGWYWSSSHCRFWLGWGLRFGTGCPDYYAEGNPARVRPVRSGPMPVKPPHPIKRPTGFNL
jgi:hypothetical protein